MSISRKLYKRPRSLSNTATPLSPNVLSSSMKIPPNLRSLKDASRGLHPLNGTLPLLKTDKASKYEDTSVSLFSNSLRNKLSKAKNTQSTKVPLMSSKSEPVKTAIYTIKIISNWGSPDLVACSEIIPIDYKNRHIPVLEITAFPRKVSLTELDKLINGFENHEDSNDIWSCSWPQEAPIEINMVVPIDSSLKMVRFFNANDIYEKAGIRNVEIWSDDILLWEGEIPYDLPYVARLQRPTGYSNEQLSPHVNSARQHTILPVNPLNCYVDPFGIVPQIPSQTLTIEFFSNYENSAAFGLSGIEIITTKKETLKSDDFAEVKVNNLSSAANIESLYRGQYMNPKIDDMFVFERSSVDHHPSITFVFKKLILVGQIRIWNFFPACGSVDDYNSNKENKAKQGICVKNISIKFDNDNTIFTGRINQGDGSLKRLDSSMTIIFVNEMDYKFMRSTKYQNVCLIPRPPSSSSLLQHQKQNSQINQEAVPRF